MSVQAFKVYNRAKRYLMDGTIKLLTTGLVLHLVQSASNFSTLTLSTLGSLTSEVASANSYTHGGKALTPTWTQGASAKQYELAAAAVVQTATGGAISNVKAVVLIATTGASAKASTNKLLAYASLSSGQFSISQNNTLTINMTGGIFTLT